MKKKKVYIDEEGPQITTEEFLMATNTGEMNHYSPELEPGTPLSVKQLNYLEVFAKTLDHEKALRESGYTQTAYAKQYEINAFFKDRIRSIQKSWTEKFELCPEMLAGKLMSTIGKLDKAINEKKYMAATALVKALELAMKTTGMLETLKQNTGPQIFFNIDLGNSEKGKTKKKTIKTVNSDGGLNVVLESSDYDNK